MHIAPVFYKLLIGIAVLFFACSVARSQPISGIWRGKMGNSRVELKLVRKGDSLIGTSYYYDSKTHYRRYTVKGYFDDQKNDVIWWDDQLVEVNGSMVTPNPSASGALLAVADFDCPGEGLMKLDGNSSPKTDDRGNKKEIHLQKINPTPVFPDEWDFLIDNYAYAVAHPKMVDSIERIAYGGIPENYTVSKNKQLVAEQEVVPGAALIAENQKITQPAVSNTTLASSVTEKPQTTIVRQSVVSNPEPVQNRQSVVVPLFVPPAMQTNEEKFTSRTKILQQVIPISGDSITLKFYDNAEIDGDSIAVFLNGHLLKEHMLLAEEAYIIKIAVADLQKDNDLVMVAENLGTIPPNTSLMVAIVEEKRFEAHLQSTEGSSALVRLVKP